MLYVTEIRKRSQRRKQNCVAILRLRDFVVSLGPPIEGRPFAARMFFRPDGTAFLEIAGGLPYNKLFEFLFHRYQGGIALIRQTLSGAWRMRRAGKGEWTEAKVPGSVLSALLEAGKTEDPFWRTNESAARELFREDYEFEKTFEAGKELLAQTDIRLVCRGLDTVASVFVNGNPVGTADNMHRVWSYGLKPFLKTGENTVRILFRSPIAYMEAKECSCPEEIPYVAAGSMRGNEFIRKAHCMFGWDWGPQLPDEGIWREIGIEAFSDAKLDDVWVRQRHEGGRVFVDANVRARVIDEKKTYAVRVVLMQPDGKENSFEAPLEKGAARVSVEVEAPRLWWPNGYGEQPLYGVHAELLAEGSVLDSRSLKIGLRTLTVSTEPDEWGSEFCFAVNGVKIFAMGADYIPEDSVLSRVTPERTEKLIRDCVRANFNCIRVWGGGYYPDDFFYDLCDRYGLIVWQDLMFACNVYRFTREFEGNIATETRDNVARIRHHACLGLWCGNNELETGWAGWPDMNSLSPKLRADYIKQFEYVLPRVVSETDPDTFYWPSSPSSGGCFDDPNAENRGDVHYWDVWHGQKPFKDYRNHYFRFCSEFGFQSFPERKTVESFTLPEDRNIFSRVMESHQKNSSANGKILYYLSETFRYPKDFNSLLYVSQILQAEAITYGVEHWRRNRGRCMGAIYWQLNDCWPVASWASIDYFGRWKALHYAAKRFFARRLATALDEDGRISYYVHNEEREPYSGVLRVEVRDRDLRILFEDEVPVNCGALSAQKVKEYDFTPLAEQYGAGRIFARYELEAEGRPAGGGVTLFTQPKYFEFKKSGYSVDVCDRGDLFAVTVKAETFCRYVDVSFEKLDAVLSDNFFSISSPEGTTVTVRKADLPAGIGAEDLRNTISVRSLADSYD